MTEITIVMLCIWAIIAIGCLVFEFLDPCLLAIWFSIGAVVALILNLFAIFWYWQVLTFIVVSFGTLMIGYPLLKNVVHRKNSLLTNTDALVNQEAIMLNNYDSTNKHSIGLAKIDGKTWTVDCYDSTQFIESEKVLITAISGVKLIIKKI